MSVALITRGAFDDLVNEKSRNGNLKISRREDVQFLSYKFPNYSIF